MSRIAKSESLKMRLIFKDWKHRRRRSQCVEPRVRVNGSTFLQSDTSQGVIKLHSIKFGKLNGSKAFSNVILLFILFFSLSKSHSISDQVSQLLSNRDSSKSIDATNITSISILQDTSLSNIQAPEKIDEFRGKFILIGVEKVGMCELDIYFLYR